MDTVLGQGSKLLPKLSLVWQFAVPATLGCLVVNPVNWACTAMLAVQPNGWEHAGALNAANQWFGALLWLSYLIAQSVMPVLSERIGANDNARSAKVVMASVKITAAMTLPLVILGSLFSQQIMGAYGEEFIGDWPTLLVSLVTCAIVAVQVPVGNLVAASGRMWDGFGMNLLWALVFLVGTWVALDWGVLGLTSARLFAHRSGRVGRSLRGPLGATERSARSRRHRRDVDMSRGTPPRE